MVGKAANTQKVHSQWWGYLAGRELRVAISLCDEVHQSSREEVVYNAVAWGVLSLPYL